MPFDAAKNPQKKNTVMIEINDELLDLAIRFLIYNATIYALNTMFLNQNERIINSLLLTTYYKNS